MQTNPLIGLNQIISLFPRVDRQHQLWISVNMSPVTNLDNVDGGLLYSHSAMNKFIHL